MTKELTVSLGDRSYPIFIGLGLIDQFREYLSGAIVGGRLLVVSNETIAPLYLERLKKGMGASEVDVVILPDGEKYKTFEYINLIFDHLLEHKHGRDSTLVALGGGYW